MNLSQKIREIENKGFKALNKFKASYNELNALACYLDLDYIKCKEIHYITNHKKVVFKTKNLKSIKEYLTMLLKIKQENKQKRNNKKMDLKRLKAIENEKLKERIVYYNQGGLFNPEELAS